MNHLRLATVDNSGPNTLASFLRSAAHSAVQIDTGVAFVTEAGLDSVLHVLKRVSARGNVRLLTGLYQGFTEPKSLITLLRAQHDSKNRLSVHVSYDQHFHWKFYCLRGKRSSQVVVGSSNLTIDGLTKSGEFNILLTMANDSAESRQLQNAFNLNWNLKSQPLTEDIVQRYEAWRVSIKLSTRFHCVPIATILGAKRRTSLEQKQETTFWRTAISGQLSDEAESLLAETTNWEKHGYMYFSTWKPTYKVGDRIILFDLSDKEISAVEIRDTTQTPNRTPDGRHFAAFSRIRKSPRRKLVPRRWKMLKSSKLIRVQGDANVTKKLSSTRFEAFVENLRLPTK